MQFVRNTRVVSCSARYYTYLFLYFFFVLIILRLSVLPEFRICFSFSLFRSLPFFLPFRHFFFIWTVVHLIGCTGLLGTDNWLANNSSNNIRAYDIQVLIYTLHRYFFVFVFRSNHIFGACSVCLKVYVSLFAYKCRHVARCEMLCHVSERVLLQVYFFFRWSIYARLEFKCHNSIK